MKMVAAEQRHHEAKARLMEAVGAEIARAELSGPEVLALLASMTGMAIAYQDQATMHPTRAMAIVMENVKLGNVYACEALAGVAPGGRVQ